MLLHEARMFEAIVPSGNRLPPYRLSKPSATAPQQKIIIPTILHHSSGDFIR